MTNPDKKTDSARPRARALLYFDPYYRRQTLALDPCGLFRIIRALEKAIEGGKLRQIFESFCTKEGAATEIYRRFGVFLMKDSGDLKTQIEVGRQTMLDYTRAEWSVMFAEDKLCLYRMGLVGAKDGDLRKATLFPPEKRALNLLRWKGVREKPAQIGLPILTERAIRAGDYKFLRKLSEAVKQPAQQFDPTPKTPGERLQFFLLRYWVAEPPDKFGKPTGALCSFSNDGLLDYLQSIQGIALECGKNTVFLDAVGNLDSDGLRMLRERLGLIQTEKPVFRSAHLQRFRRNRALTGNLVVSDWK